MRFLKKLVLTAILLGSYAVTLAKPVNSVKAIREDVDGAYIGNQARFKVSGNSSFLARAGFRMPVGSYDVNVVGAYDGKPSLSVGILGDRAGIEATFAEEKKSASLEGCVAGFMGQGNIVSTKDGSSENFRLSRAESFGPATLQLGVSGSRDEKNHYGVCGDIFGVIVEKAGKTTIIPYCGATFDKSLDGYKYIGLIVIPSAGKASIGLGLGNGSDLRDLGKYNLSVEIRYGFN